MEENLNGKPRIWLSVGLKINLGNYESASVDAGMSVDLEPQETPEEGFKRVRAVLTSEVTNECLRIRKGKYAKVTS